MEISKKTKERLSRNQGHLINGKSVSSTELMDVIDPATGERITSVCLGGEEEINAAVIAARNAFAAWSGTSPDERTQCMLRFAALVEANAEQFKQLSIVDGGLIDPFGESSAAFAAAMLRYYAGWTSKITGQTLPSTANGSQAPGDLLAFTLREPIGVVGAITPWNYPAGMEILKIAPALAAGCTMVLKPAEDAPTPGLLLAELALEAGVPAGVLNVVNGKGEVAGAALAAHPDLDKIAFTGSTEVGKLVVQAAMGNLKKVSLELGGKSPVFIFPDADLDKAIPGAGIAGVALSGQNCVCGSRLFVHKDIADKVAEGMADFLKTLPVGPGSDPANVVGPIISERQLERVEGIVQRAQDEGAELVAGGKRIERDGWFMEPTLFNNCSPDMEIVRDEVFGPVIAMQVFDDSHSLEDLAAMANDTQYGLSGSVWTRDIQTGLRMIKLINSGQLGVNCHAVMDTTMPFGGSKQSGWGSEFGEEGLLLYTKTKAVTVALT